MQLVAVQVSLKLFVSVRFKYIQKIVIVRISGLATTAHDVCSGPSVKLGTGRHKQGGERSSSQLLLRLYRFARSEKTGGLTARRSRRLL